MTKTNQVCLALVVGAITFLAIDVYLWPWVMDEMCREIFKCN